MIAACDLHDYLEAALEVKTYIAIYEPTIPAFKSAVAIMSSITQPSGCLPVSSRSATHDIRRFGGSKDDINHIWKLWVDIFPTWPIEQDRLANLLERKGQHYVHDYGFCLSYYDAVAGDGSIACVGVCESQRGQGIGTALITKAQQELRTAALSHGLDSPKSLGIRSVFPRFWPGVPSTLSSKDKDFFLHRGQ